MPVVKVIKLVGSSPNSWEEAAQNAVAEAAKTLRNITGIELLEQTAEVSGGRVTEFRSTVNLAFLIEGSDAGGSA